MCSTTLMIFLKWTLNFNVLEYKHIIYYIPTTIHITHAITKQPLQSCVCTFNAVVTTYPSAGGRHGACGCVFHGRKMRGVATNVYSRKTSEKPERCGLRTLSVKDSGVVFTHGEDISTPRVRHKGRQPLIECANMTSNCFIFPFLRFYVFLRLLYFFFMSE